MTAPATTYQEAGRRLLAQARVELDAGDLRQASEKGWGAAAQTVKAAAQQRGWPLNHHRALFVAVRELSNEAGDPELHVNFYEDTFDADKVARNLDRTEQFIAKLEHLPRA